MFKGTSEYAFCGCNANIWIETNVYIKRLNTDVSAIMYIPKDTDFLSVLEDSECLT